MHPSVNPFADLLGLNTDLLLNCLDGLREEDARWRPAADANHAAFLTAHLIDMRHYLASLLGRGADNPVAALLNGARRLDDIRTFPPLPGLRSAWRDIGAHLERVLGDLREDDLARSTPQRHPGSDGTVLGGLAFVVQHESYHLGQVALLRRLCGHPAMSYRRHPVP
jgi:uncharacterized damage-inducible protein DinB